MVTAKLLLVLIILSPQFFCYQTLLQSNKEGLCSYIPKDNVSWLYMIYASQLDVLAYAPANGVFFGDSLVFRWILNLNSIGYNWRTQESMGDAVNMGVYGDNVCKLILRMHKHVTIFQPKYIFIDGGGNDFIENIPIQEIRIEILTYITLIRQENPTARVIYLGIPPSKISIINKNKYQINDFINLLMERIHNACYIDLSYAISIDGTDDSPIQDKYSYDIMHFNSYAYIILKKLTDNALKGQSIYKSVWCY